jgi:hypothetical protein
VNIPFESFLAIAKETCALSANASDWIVESDLYPGDPWIRVTNLNAVPTKQGWKIHVSAMHESATSVLERAFSVLLPETASFKLACSIDSLMLLNEGEFGLSQIGKFITIASHVDCVGLESLPTDSFRTVAWFITGMAYLMIRSFKHL